MSTLNGYEVTHRGQTGTYGVYQVNIALTDKQSIGFGGIKNIGEFVTFDSEV